MNSDRNTTTLAKDYKNKAKMAKQMEREKSFELEQRLATHGTCKVEKKISMKQSYIHRVGLIIKIDDQI